MDSIFDHSAEPMRISVAGWHMILSLQEAGEEPT